MQERFRFIFLTVVSLSVFCGISAFAVAVVAVSFSSPFFEPLFDGLMALFTFGVGAVFGLIGGSQG